MNAEKFAAQWKQLRGRVRAQWGKLTDDELDQIAGNYEMLVGKIQEKYGLAREQVERQLEPMLMEEPAVKPKGA
jgi:uncharacterized protein YjbJ (UPF0337 family)